jgi:hypothetical protein
MNPRLMTPLLLGVVIVLLLYRRARRSFGRQPINAARLSLRAGLLCAVGALVLSTIWRDTRLVQALAAGLAAGGLLARLGLAHTRFDASAEGRFYTPHSYIGVTVLVLFVARLVYRVASGHADLAALQATPGGSPVMTYQQNPVTLALLGVPIGYYVLYNLGVLRRSRALAGSPPGTANP